MISTKKKWKKEEEEFLIMNYYKTSNKELAKYLSRTYNAFTKKAIRLGLNKIIWTPEQEEYLKQNYKTKTVGEMMVDINKTRDAISQRLSKLRLLKSLKNLSEIQKRVKKNYAKGKKHPAWKYKVEIKNCKTCGKEILYKNFRISLNMWDKKNFCSISCSLKTRNGERCHFWNGGEKNWKRDKYLYSSREWKNIRSNILGRDSKKCIICEVTENLHIHHKQRYKDGGENTEENLVTLCNKHHHQLHALEIFYKNNHSPRDFSRLCAEIKLKHKSNSINAVVL